MDNNDHNTWVYHALKDAKIVKASEAKKLYKQGWRDSPDPKTLFKGIRGKWYKIVIKQRSFKLWATKNPNVSIPLVVMTILSIITILVTLFAHFDSNTVRHTTQKTDTKTK